MSAVLRTDIADVGYLRNILGMIAWYEPKRNLHTYLNILQKLQPFWDILIVSDEPEIQTLKQAIKLATKIRLKSKDTSFVRNELITAYPELREVINSYRGKEPLFKDILNDLLVKYKSFAALKFARDLQSVILESLNPQSMSELYESINSKIQEFYNDAQLDIASTEIRYSVDEVEDRIEQRIKELTESVEKRSFIPSRLQLLNLAFANKIGYEKGCLYMYGAPTGGGKTRMAISEGAHIYQAGFNIVHITIENPESKVSDLYDSCLLGISTDELYRLYRQSVGNEEARRKVNEIIQALKEAIQQREISKLIIKKFRPLATNPLMIENYLLSLMADGIVPDVVIVDHVDILIPNSGRRDNMFQAGEEITAQMKDIAERYGFVLILPSQLNRGGNRKKKKKNPYDDVITRTDVSRSSAKLELVDFFATLNRTTNEKFNNRLRLYIDKNRDGVEDLILPCYFDTGNLELRNLYTLSELGDYQESVYIPKSLAVLYFRACQDDTLKPHWINNLKEFYPYLPMALRYKASEILGDDIGSCELCKVSDNSQFLQAHTFIHKLIELAPTHDILDIEREGSDVKVGLVDRESGEYICFKTDIEGLQNLLEEYEEGDIQYQLITKILTTIGII